MDYMTFTSKIPDGFYGYFIAQFTDAYLVGEWPQNKADIEPRFHKLLEIRVFNKDAEYKLFRSSIGSALQFRSIDSSMEMLKESGYADFYDEEQFLDVDTDASQKSFKEDHLVTATGGGRYRLPIADMNNAKIRIRCYFNRYESGQAKVSDWRIVDFVEGA